MAEKHTTYTVNRSMHGDGRDYARGDTREMSQADAAPLLASGALSEEGKDALVRDPAVRHTFGTELSETAERGYTTPTGDGVIAGTPPVVQAAELASRTTATVAVTPRPRRG